MQIEKKGPEAKVEMQMTPMIDIVFQLLTFFIMSFKIVAAEGDFDINMPLAARSEGLPPEDKLPPMKVRLMASSGGQLSKIKLNDNDFGISFDGLHNYIISVIGDERGPGSRQETAEVELGRLEGALTLDSALKLAQGRRNEDLLRLAHEYLPLTFSRRHGDPSRPWNDFSIIRKNGNGSEYGDVRRATGGKWSE